MEVLANTGHSEVYCHTINTIRIAKCLKVCKAKFNGKEVVVKILKHLLTDWELQFKEEVGRLMSLQSE